MHIEINEQFKKALEVIENTPRSVFITGKAGSGKSTLLQYFRGRMTKKMVVLAPTGVAALNVQGETIHSFFGFKPDITREKVKRIKKKENRRIFESLDAIVIDEISMVRADLMDCIDRFLRLNGKKDTEPFGGMQMIFFGDLYQLPPVVTSAERQLFSTRYKSPYFFSADVFNGYALEIIELEKIYRQRDETFIALLNAIRNNTVTEQELKLLDKRVGAPLAAAATGELSIHLTTTNDASRAVNAQHLAQLKGKVFTFHADIMGTVEKNSYPTDEVLQLKRGAQVMFLTNDEHDRWVNGTLGEIREIRAAKKDEDAVIVVSIPHEGTVELTPFTWEIFHSTWNATAGQVETDIVGEYTQYPIKLAWAVTIHKSQGKTFNRVIIDMGRGAFAPGQVYVALSRCTALEGMSLARPINRKTIFTDWRIRQYLTQYQYALSARAMATDDKVIFLEHAIREKKCVRIIYLKSSDVKSTRIIKPIRVGECSYEGRKFLGLIAFCQERGEQRTFRVDRILEMDFAGEEE